MDIRKLQRAIVDGLEDVKAQHINVFNTEHLSAMFERVIVCSGTSNRQTKALAASVRDSVRKRGMEVLSVEGEENGEWIVVDCGAAVAHIMQPAIREYYHLEEIWGGKNVNVKVGAAKTGLVKASEPDAAPAGSGSRKVAAKKTAVKATAADKKMAAAKKVANQTAAYKRVASGKSPARKAAAPGARSPAPSRPRSVADTQAPAPAQKAVARSASGLAAPVRKAAVATAAPAKTAPARTAASKAAPVKAAPVKAAAKKAPAKKVGGKKPPARPAASTRPSRG